MASEFSRSEAAGVLRAPGPRDDKYTRGVVGMRTGSTRFPGAAVLGVDAAWRAGAGMVRYHGPDLPRGLVLQRRPETVVSDGRVEAWVIGSGTDAADRAHDEREALLHLLGGSAPVVVDAGALDLVGEHAAPLVLTPHAGELARLRAAHGLPDDLDVAEVSERLGAVIVAKGAVTQIVAGKLWRRTVTAPTAWLSTAGTGDVLAGIIGTLIAAGSPEPSAAELAQHAAAAAWIHGQAALAASTARGGGPIVALDVAEAVPAVIGALLHADAAHGTGDSRS